MTHTLLRSLPFRFLLVGCWIAGISHRYRGRRLGESRNGALFLQRQRFPHLPDLHLDQT
jgi:hypothetical protein